MASGLIALLDDVAAIAKVAAASLDDIAAQTAKAGAKAAGIVIDDTAVTPAYVVGFAANRELPIIWKIAVGSLRNKLLILLPAALALTLVAPWSITPLLMLGGAYLCFEGFEKIWHALMPHEVGHAETIVDTADPVALEKERVAGAIKTDFILSAEIMAITLAGLPPGSFVQQAVVLASVGLAVTVVVYGLVALIVKADDAGMALALSQRPVSGLFGRRDPSMPTALDRMFGPLVRGFGRGLVQGMPILLRVLSVVGTAAMLWVGGGIIIHGLEVMGWAAPAHAVHDVAVVAAGLLPAGLSGLGAIVEWLVGAVIAAIVGLVVGGLVLVLVQQAINPVLARWRGRNVSAVAKGGTAH